MLEVIWTIINLGIFVLILLFLINIYRFIKHKYGNIFSIIFLSVVVFLVLLYKMDKNNNDVRIEKPYNIYEDRIRISNNDSAKLFLFVGSEIDNYNYSIYYEYKSDLIPVYLFIDWNTEKVNLRKEDNLLKYEIIGYKQWYLFTIPIFRQEKKLQGDIQI